MMRFAPLLLVACAPSYEPSNFRHEMSLHTEDAAGTTASLVATIDSATRTLDVALPAIEDTALSSAIVRAKDRGVTIRAITDVDQAEDAGVVALMDADVPLTLADGSLAYFDFSINQDVLFSSSVVRMTHAWAVADATRATVATEAGTTEAGTRLVLDLRGEDLMEDLWTEHNQVFGGADATATTAYDDQAKSIADFRWSYPTDSEVMVEMWLGPQERLTKRLIDAIYSARANVWISSSRVMNEGIIRAAQFKGDDGFDVRLVVGPDQPPGNVTQRGDPVLFLERETPDVDKHKVDDAYVPTVVVIDSEEARDGFRYPTRVFLLSHDLVSASRLLDGVGVENDQLIDGNLWVLEDGTSGPLHEDVQEVIGVFTDLYDRGAAYP